MIDAQLGSVVAVLLRNARGDHDHRQVSKPVVGADVAHEVKAVHARHFDVRQHHHRALFGQTLKRLESILGSDDAVAFARQQALRDAAHGQRVVHHQHQRRHLLHRLLGHGTHAAVRQAHARARTVGIHRGQRHRVVDQCHRARGQQRHTHQARQARQLRADVLDHHLLVAHHFVDVDGDTLRGAANYHHHLRARRGVAARAGLQQRCQPVEGDTLAVEIIAAAGIGGLGLGTRHALDDLDQRRRHRNLEFATAQVHDLRDSSGQRQEQPEACALATRTRGFDAAAHRIHFGAHDVQADAAAGELAHRLDRGEAGREDQLRKFGIAHGLLAAQQTALLGARADALVVEAAAIVAKFHRHFVAGLRYLHHDAAGGVLAGRRALAWGFNAVHDAVAQQVLEGADHALQHAAVKLDGAAHDIKPHLFARFLARLAHRAVEAVGGALELHHARAQEVVLQFAREAGLRGELVFRGLQRALHTALQGGHVVDRLGHETREFLETREAVHLQRVEGLASSTCRLQP